MVAEKGNEPGEASVGMGQIKPLYCVLRDSLKGPQEAEVIEQIVQIRL